MRLLQQLFNEAKSRHKPSLSFNFTFCRRYLTNAYIKATRHIRKPLSETFPLRQAFFFINKPEKNRCR